MENPSEVGAHLAMSAMVQLHMCLRSLDIMGCKIAAVHVEAALSALKEDLCELGATSMPPRPDGDFAELDSLVDEILRRERRHWRC